MIHHVFWLQDSIVFMYIYVFLKLLYWFNTISVKIPSWRNHGSLPEVGVPPPSFLELKIHCLKCKCFSSEGEKGGRGYLEIWLIKKSYKSSPRILVIIRFLCLVWTTHIYVEDVLYFSTFRWYYLNLICKLSSLN